MRALDDLGRAIVAPDAFDQLVVRLPGAFRNENVARSSQVPRRLTQRPPRQQVLVAEGRLLIDQDDVEAVLEMKVLQSVIQQERVGLEFFDRKQAAFDPILVDQHDDVLQVIREHVGLVAGGE